MPKLQYRFKNATKDIELYDTPQGGKNIAVRIDGKIYYAALYSANDVRASNLKILRDGTTYAVASDSTKQLLENFTWDEIAAIIKAGDAPSTFAVGDTKPVTLGSAILDSGNDVAGTYRVQILGIDHNAEIEGSNRVHFAIGRDADNTTDIVFYGHKMNSTDTNAGGWEASEMRTWLNETFYNVLPTDLQSVITACTKYTDNVGDGTNLAENVTVTSDKIWIPAPREVVSVGDYENSHEKNKQAKYEYYYATTTKQARYRHTSIKYKCVWWLRSPCRNEQKSFCEVAHANDLHNGFYNSASAEIGVVPCFTIS